MKRRAEALYPNPGDPIFPARNGKLCDPRSYRRHVFNPAAKRAGVEWATPHKLRHGLASLMARQGASPAQIAARLGHADGGVLALRTYIHDQQLDDTAFIDDAFAVQAVLGRDLDGDLRVVGSSKNRNRKGLQNG